MTLPPPNFSTLYRDAVLIYTFRDTPTCAMHRHLAASQRHGEAPCFATTPCIGRACAIAAQKDAGSSAVMANCAGLTRN